MEKSATNELTDESDDSSEFLEAGFTSTEYLLELARDGHWLSEKNCCDWRWLFCKVQQMMCQSAGKEERSARGLNVENSLSKKKNMSKKKTKKKTSVEERALTRDLHTPSTVSGGPANLEVVSRC